MLSFLSPFLPSKSRRGGTRVETLSKIYRRLIGSCHISLGRLRYIAIYRIQYIGTGCTWHLALTWKNFSKVVNTSEHPQEHRPDSHPPNLSLILSTLARGLGSISSTLQTKRATRPPVLYQIELQNVMWVSSMARVSSVTSTVSIFTHQGHISQVGSTVLLIDWLSH